MNKDDFQNRINELKLIKFLYCYKIHYPIYSGDENYKAEFCLYRDWLVNSNYKPYFILSNDLSIRYLFFAKKIGSRGSIGNLKK